MHLNKSSILLYMTIAIDDGLSVVSFGRPKIGRLLACRGHCTKMFNLCSISPVNLYSCCACVSLMVARLNLERAAAV